MYKKVVNNANEPHLLLMVMTQVFIGTSGWSYPWNLGNSLDWYLTESGLNAIELNMSYYRFPYPNMVQSWARKASSLAWVVKLHRSITHLHKLNKESYQIFQRFRTLFSPLENSIHYYLIQLPPRFNNVEACEHFIDACGNEKLAFEFREPSLFTDEVVAWGKKHGVLIVSVDAPQLPSRIMSESTVYERVHGRHQWYSHDYTNQELMEIKERIMRPTTEMVYVFFNNNHAMLENARRMCCLFHSRKTLV